jgi:high-affinity nickel-transport protein
MMIFSMSNGAASFHIGLVLTALGFGFRHGIDWDHIAALTDITGAQDTPRRSMRFATLYALGHGLVVLALGAGAILFAEELPASVDSVMERVVGATLIVLGLYVGVALIRRGRDFRMRSRWMLIFSGVRRAVRWAGGERQRVVIEVLHDHDHDHHHTHAADAAHREAHARVLVSTTGDGSERGHGHRHPHRHVGELPDDPFMTYGSRSAFGVGMIHGVGAETPTQVLIFLAAAGAGGKLVGLMLLGCFLIGLLTSNTLIALAGTFGFLGATRNFRLYVGVSVATAVFSLAIGSLFLFGQGTMLPAFFGG